MRYRVLAGARLWACGAGWQRVASAGRRSRSESGQVHSQPRVQSQSSGHPGDPSSHGHGVTHISRQDAVSDHVPVSVSFRRRFGPFSGASDYGGRSLRPWNHDTTGPRRCTLTNLSHRTDETVQAERATSNAAARLLEGIADRLGVVASVRSVFGESVEHDGITVIPVAKVRIGFGGGTGSEIDAGNKREGGGGGGGGDARPAGFIELSNGRAVYRPVRDPWTGVAVALAMVLGLASVAALARNLVRLRKHTRRSESIR